MDGSLSRSLCGRWGRGVPGNSWALKLGDCWQMAKREILGNSQTGAITRKRCVYDLVAYETTNDQSVESLASLVRWGFYFIVGSPTDHGRQLVDD